MTLDSSDLRPDRAPVFTPGDEVSASTSGPRRFFSILFVEPKLDSGAASVPVPDYFHDLNLDQIVAGATAGMQEYDLDRIFHERLGTSDAIDYRHEVMRDLEDERILGCVNKFASTMRRVRRRLEQSSKLYFNLQKQRWFLHAAETYCTAVCDLGDGLSSLDPRSRGLRALREYVTGYARSESFTTLHNEIKRIESELGAIRYSLRIKDAGFKLRKYAGERDYGAEVADTFRKFQQGEVKSYLASFADAPDMNHIEAQALEFVALLHPEEFSRLARFVAEHRDFADPILTSFDREVHFYIGYLNYIAPLKKAGLRFCYPRIATSDKEIDCAGGFDLALAAKLTAQKATTVCNDFYLRGPERIIIVSGPNQGGKTTFARMFGQLHHLASVGCPVPGSSARLFLFDSMFSHFEREEDIRNLHGKLQDDLFRIHGILEKSTARSVIVLNEIFNSTTLKDAVFLARKVIERIDGLDCLCVCVTFLDELASLSERTVSMLSTVVPDDPATRTFRVVRRPADGKSYAISIAEKYRLTYQQIKDRLSDEGLPSI